MAEDREQLFEKALERHFRAARPGTFPCLDSETLAAYHEGTLSTEETAAAKMHLASCARCSEILAAVGSSEAGSEREEPEMVLAGVAAEAAARTAPESSATTREVAPLRKRKLFPLGLMVPAGAVAAGLLLWIGLFRAHPKFTAAPSEVAVNRSELPAGRESSEELKGAEAPKSLGQAQQPLDAQALQSTDRKKSPPVLANDFAELQKLQEHARRAAVPPAPGPTAPAVQAKRQAQPGAPGPEASGLPARSESRLATGAVEAASEAADSVPTPAPSAKPAVSGAAGTPMRPRAAAAAATRDKNSAADRVSLGAVYNAVATTALEVRIAAPGGQKIWSVGANGLILYSKDGGRTWMPQLTGVSEALTGGFAPSEDVCWVAGVAGTLLRTTDGGQHWQRIRTPITGDLGGVHAADAQHASIWDLPNHTSYETADGGANWKPTANE